MKNEWLIGNDSGWFFVRHINCPENYRGSTYSGEVRKYKSCWHCGKVIPNTILLQINLLYGN